MKTTEQHFTDWESNTFGYGMPVLQALKQFLALCNKGQHTRSYDYEELEKALTAPVAWLLINALAHDDKIEYGTSPRYGWLTKEGEALADFVKLRTVEQLYDLTGSGEHTCYPDHCNCDDGIDCRSHNPFWSKR